MGDVVGVYTLVVKTSDEVTQDELIKRVDAPNIAVVFCGPGQLVESPEDEQEGS